MPEARRITTETIGTAAPVRTGSDAAAADHVAEPGRGS